MSEDEGDVVFCQMIVVPEHTGEELAKLRLIMQESESGTGQIKEKVL